MPHEQQLDALLQKLQEGTASEAELEQVQILLQSLEQEFDLGLNQVIEAEAGIVNIKPDLVDTALPFALHDVELLPLALKEESGDIDVLAGVMARLEFELLDIKAAVLADGRTGEVTDAVMEQIGFVAVDLQGAVQAEAGRVDVAPQIAAYLGMADLTLAAAVHAEAGRIAIADRVMRKIQRSFYSIGEDVPDRKPANRAFPWAAIMVAAGALIVFMVGRISETVPDAPLIQVESPTSFAALQFASGEEIRVENLNYGNGSGMVEVPEGDGTAFIIWVSEEGQL